MKKNIVIPKEVNDAIDMYLENDSVKIFMGNYTK